MKIELKKIKFSEHLSEETNAFTAEIYINGKNAGYARNDGRGGCTDYHAHGGKRDLIEQAEQHCLTLPPINYGTFQIDMNLENKIDQLFEEWLKSKGEEKLQKDMLKGICFKIDGGYSISSWKGHALATLLQNPNGKQAVKNHLKKLVVS